MRNKHLGTKATINLSLRNLGFNWMGGSIYKTDHEQPSGFKKLDHNDPWLDGHLNVESEQWHAFAIDKKYYYCFALNSAGAFPALPSRVRKGQVETIQVEPSALGEGPNLNRVNRQLVKDLDILTAPLDKCIWGVQRSGHLVGVQKFGVYVIGKDESHALRELPRWLGILGIRCFQLGYNIALADHIYVTGTKWIVDDLQEQAAQLKIAREDPNSELNQFINNNFPE